VDSKRQIASGLILLSVAVLLGTLGYMLIEGVPFFDSLYMVVITVSTVGFEQEFPLSTMGRIWTMVVIGLGLGATIYTAVASIEYLVDLREVRQKRLMERDISRLSGHIVLCGFGRVGRGVWTALRDRDLDVVIIEADGERAENARSGGALVVHGDATHNDVLELSGVESAEAVVACVEDDSDNLVIALSVKSLRPELRVICRATELESERKLRLAGADAVVAPQAVGAERIAMMAIQPELAQVFDVVVSGNAVEFRVEELDIHPDCSVAGETIRDSGLRQHTGALILAVEGEGDSVIVNPGPDQVLSPGERLVVVGTKDQVDRAAELLQPTQ
jgi:voltage-gated potassium channel